jgi:hypothetical protein
MGIKANFGLDTAKIRSGLSILNVFEMWSSKNSKKGKEKKKRYKKRSKHYSERED